MVSQSPFDAKLRAALEPVYDLERELPGGGMSRVFLAIERSLNRKVVIKVLPPDLAAGVNRERFQREIQLAAQLQHPHIVPLYSASEHDDLLYYSMPYIEGESLKYALNQRGTKQRFALKEVVSMLHDVVDALAYAHERGVIHRDIKPGNVLRSGRHALVTDFGVAKAISAAMPAVGMTTSGMAIGTPAYMAPEQLAGDPAADHRVDIYAVGLLAYELLTGEAPFNEASPQETMAAQLTRDPEPISHTRSDVPPALSALVMRCLEKSPDQRPQHAAELLTTLDELSVSSGDYLPAKRPRRYGRPLLLGAVAAALALFAVRNVRARQGAPTMPVVPAGPVIAPKRHTPPRTTPLITRADSLAIATAMAKYVAPAQRPLTADEVRRMNDSIANSIERRLLDSLVRVVRQVSAASNAPPTRQGPPPMGGGMQGPPPPGGFGGFGGRRRIVVTEWADPKRPDLVAIAQAVADSLRLHLSRNNRFALVPVDSNTRTIMNRSQTLDNVARALDTELFASVRVMPQKTDSLRLYVTLTDFGAMQDSSRRAAITVTPIGRPLASAQQLIGMTFSELFNLSRVTRRNGDPRMHGGPNGPFGGPGGGPNGPGSGTPQPNRRPPT